MTAHFILYVHDQKRSTDFYRRVLQIEPTLDVPGMTEFPLGSDSILGLMPEVGIKKLLGSSITDPTQSNGISRAELYLRVTEPAGHYSRALASGAKILSPIQARNWGDEAGYIMDLDGHVIAFARPIA